MRLPIVAAACASSLALLTLAGGCSTSTMASSSSSGDSTKSTVGHYPVGQPPGTDENAPALSSPASQPSNPTEAAITPRVSGNHLTTASGAPLVLQGVNISDTDTACIQGWGFSGGSLDGSEATAIASWNVNAVRIPLNEDCWLGINGAPQAYSGARYQTAIRTFVYALNTHGIVAILSLHTTAPGSIKATTDWPLPDADHAPTFWSEVASEFAKDPSVVFDVFNEPSAGGPDPTTADWSCWLSGCLFTHKPATCAPSCKAVTYQTAGSQQLVNVIRSEGADQPILVAGLSAADDLCDPSNGGVNGASCAWEEYKPNDPLDQIVASFHTATDRVCVTAACWQQQVGILSQYVPVVATEVIESDCSAQYVTQYISWARQHGTSYLAWAWQTPSQVDGASGCAALAHALIADWSGTPASASPVGAAVKSLFAAFSITR